MESPHVFQDEREWRDFRRNFIGASDASAVCGMNPYRQPLDVYASKVEPPRDEGSGNTWPKRRGLMAEDMARAEFARKTGLDIRPLGKSVFVSETHPFMACTPDGVVEKPDDGGSPIYIEIKAPGTRASAEWNADEEAPIHHQLQVQHGLHCTGLERGMLLKLDWDDGLAIIPVQRHQKAIDTLVEKEAAFWERVKRQDPPPPAREEDFALFWKLKYQSDDGTTVLLPEDLKARAEVLEEAKREIKRWEELREEIQMDLKRAIGPASFGRWESGGGYSLKEIKRDGYAVAATSYRQLRRIK